MTYNEEASTKVETTNLKIETIDDGRNTVKKEWELDVETISQEYIQLPSQEYGNWQQTLDAQIALRNLTTGWAKYFFWNSSRTSAQGTGAQAITWVGFTPTLVKIHAVRSASNWSGYLSLGTATWPSNEFVVYVSPGGTTDYANNRIIYTANWRAELHSIDTDGFTLNWTTMTENVTFSYECYA